VVRGVRCALPLEHVIETMRPLPLEALGSAPTFVRGVAVIRGTPVPVVDVGALLGTAEGERPARFVTLSIHGRLIALAVEGVVGVRTLPADVLGALPPLLRGVGSDAVAALGTLDSALLLTLRAARLVPDGDVEAVPPARGPA
jgi:purine-binding chemotaxis protein CheW